jgi:hypothetical protein
MEMDGGIIADLVARHAEEVPYWGHLPAAMRFKQAAVARLGVAAAFDACVPHLGVPGLDALHARDLLPLRDADPSARQLWPGGAQFDRPLPRVLGESNVGPLPGRERAGYLARLDGVRLRGRSSLLLHDGQLLIDAEPEEFAGLPDNPEYDPGVLHADGARLWTMEADAPQLRVDEAYLLSGNHSVDFGHWIVEYLPRYAMAAAAGLPAGTPVLVDAIVPGTILDALPALLPPGTPVLRIPHLGSVDVGRLWCASNPVYGGFYPTVWTPATWSSVSTAPGRMAWMVRELLGLLSRGVEEPTRSEKIFLARRASRHKKKLLNHAEIEGIAIARGFRVVYPEDHSLVEQVALARQATHIVAPEGSQALLAWFARPGARTCLLSPPYALPLVDINAIFAALDVDLTVLTGPDEPTEDDFCGYWNDYHIDAARFAAFLDDWAA